MRRSFPTSSCLAGDDRHPVLRCHGRRGCRAGDRARRDRATGGDARGGSERCRACSRRGRWGGGWGRTAPCRLADDRRVDVGTPGPCRPRTPDTYGVGMPVSHRDSVRRVSTGGHALVGGASSFCSVAGPLRRAHRAARDRRAERLRRPGRQPLRVGGPTTVVDVVNREVERRRAPRARSSSTRRTGTRRSPRTSPRTAAPGRSTASPSTWGADLHAGLRPGRPPVRKGVGGEDGYSGFSMVAPRPRARPRRPASTTCCAGRRRRAGGRRRASPPTTA